MAYIRKLSKSWRAEIVKDGVRKTKAGFRTKRAAEMWAASVEADILLGRKASNKKFGDLLSKYFVEETPKKKGAAQERVKILKLQEHSLSKIPIDELTSRPFAEFRDERLKEVKPGTVKRELAILSAVCTVAVKEWELLDSNPLRKIRQPKSTKPRNRVASDKEIALLKNLSGFGDNTPEAITCAVFLFGCETAMRRGEILTLDEKSVNLSKRIAELEETKNGDDRIVPLTTEAIKLWKEYGPFQIKKYRCSQLFKKLCRLSEIQDLTLHDSRRVGTSRLAKKVDVMTLAKITGHRDLKVLLNTYYSVDMSDVAKSLS